MADRPPQSTLKRLLAEIATDPDAGAWRRWARQLLLADKRAPRKRKGVTR